MFPLMRDIGLLATLNTDDPALVGLVGLDLTQDYELCATAIGYGFDDTVRIALDAVRASWLDEGAAAALVSELNDAATATY